MKTGDWKWGHTGRNPRRGDMRLRRPMTEAPYEFDIDHPGRASGYPVWASITLPRSSPRTWPTGHDLDSGVVYLQIADYRLSFVCTVLYTIYGQKAGSCRLISCRYFFFLRHLWYSMIHRDHPGSILVGWYGGCFRELIRSMRVPLLSAQIICLYSEFIERLVLSRSVAFVCFTGSGWTRSACAGGRKAPRRYRQPIRIWPARQWPPFPIFIFFYIRSILILFIMDFFIIFFSKMGSLALFCTPFSSYLKGKQDQPKKN